MNLHNLWTLDPHFSKMFAPLGIEVLGAFSLESKESLFREDSQHLKKWVEEKRHGSMSFLERNHEVRENPDRILTGVQSAIVILCPYAHGKRKRKRLGTKSPHNRDTANTSQKEFSTNPLSPLLEKGLIAKYAWGKDYHRILKKLEKSIQKIFSQTQEDPFSLRLIVDSVPFFDRAAGKLAQLGFIGKNTLLIRPGLGSYFFIATVLTTLPIETFGKPQTKHNPFQSLNCGECKLCMEACPTQAIIKPGVLDSPKCLSYLTIEHKGLVENHLVSHFRHTIFGCDICQDVCPYNWVTNDTPILNPFQPLNVWSQLDLESIALMTQKEYENWFGGTSLTRAGYISLIRNSLYCMFAISHTALGETLKTLQERDTPQLRPILEHLNVLQKHKDLANRVST